MGSILNLVFDKWDGDKPLPNLNFLNEKCKDAINIQDFVNSLELQLKDLEELRTIGCSGAIVGKAIYENKISLSELSIF
jgi:phosphoribosylformimino-5-aminoimidazole carboxamide ribotide isomerase